MLAALTGRKRAEPTQSISVPDKVLKKEEAPQKDTVNASKEEVESGSDPGKHDGELELQGHASSDGSKGSEMSSFSHFSLCLHNPPLPKNWTACHSAEPSREGA